MIDARMMDGIDHNATYIRTVDHVLSATTCAEWIQRVQEMSSWHLATVNTSRGPRQAPSMRSNERVILDDPDLAQTLASKLAGHLPAKIHGYSFSGINERMRIQRYRPGMHFAPHPDGAFVRDGLERSYYSVLVYLNEGFDGGDTVFLTSPEVVIRPKTGRVALFQHPIVHEGVEVRAGTKYIIRTDAMFSRHV